jgi:hypothetical protein
VLFKSGVPLLVRVVGALPSYWHAQGAHHQILNSGCLQTTLGAFVIVAAAFIAGVLYQRDKGRIIEI